MSLYSTRHGFACDSVLDFEIALASGNVVHANAKENADLFVSLKGGLNNFGVVTGFEMKTIPLGEIWGGVSDNHRSIRRPPLTCVTIFLSRFANLCKPRGVRSPTTCPIVSARSSTQQSIS